MQIAFLEREGEALLMSLARQRFVVSAGLEFEPRQALIFARFAELCSVETFEQLQDEPLDVERHRELMRLVAHGICDAAVAHLDDELVRRELSADVPYLADAVPLREALAMLVEENERDRRHMLATSVGEAIARFEEPRVRRANLLRQTVSELQAPSHMRFVADLNGLDLDRLSELSRALVENTADLYDHALMDQLVHLRIDEGDVWEVDLAWIFRGVEHDAIFESQKLLPAIYRTLLSLGIPLQDQSNIRIDLARRRFKVVSPVCVPLAVPDEVQVSIRPFGGRRDLAAMWTGLGEAEQFAYVDRTQPLARRWLGDDAVGRAFGLLFEHLLLEPGWLADYLEADSTRDAIRLSGLASLYQLRRAAARLPLDLQIAAAEEPDVLRDEFAESLGDAIGARVSENEYLDVFDEPLRSANLMRAWMLAGQIDRFLRQEFDDEWFRSPRAGSFLADLWRGGRRYSCEELARHLGFAGLDAQPMLEKIQIAIGS